MQRCWLPHVVSNACQAQSRLIPVCMLQNGIANVAARVTNSSQDIAYVDRCGSEIDWAAERLENGDWQQAGGGICFAIAVPPVQVAQGRV